MSLKMNLGDRGNLLEAKPEYAKRLKLDSPVLNEDQLEAIRQSGFQTADWIHCLKLQLALKD
jgi:glutamate synthase (ferredoxin)